MEERWLRKRPLWLIFLWLCAIVSGASVGKPLNIPPSQYWDGKDGPWSTFRIEIGTPAQQIRILPASDQTTTWLVIPEVCGNTVADDCSDSHGGLYTRNTSSTWEQFGAYELDTRFLEANIGLDGGGGLYGFDKITLGWSGDGLPSLDNQSIAGIFGEDFWTGSLSVYPRPVNFSDQNEPIPSLMQRLRNASEPIPSLSWSYTAGSYNLSPKKFGSLVLGGYDQSRFEPNDVTFPFGEDISLDLQVTIQDVTCNTTAGSLLGTSIVSYISTLVADIWLPTSACEKFEEAFGLVWDEQTELYPLNDTLHQFLLKTNSEVRFKLGPEAMGDSVTIHMPYWNFFHAAASDLAGDASGSYFPLKRAANDSQYILGRTFLQSAHLSTDYERNIFNISQALYPSSSTDADIVAVLSPSTDSSSGSGDGNNEKSSGSSLGTGAIAGIAVGVVALIAIAIGAWFLFRRKKTKAKKVEELEDTDIQENLAHEVSGDMIKYELGDGLAHEVAGDMDPKAELAAADTEKPAEFDGAQKMAEVDGADRPIYEMPGVEPNAAEMPNEEREVPEMSGESPYSKSLPPNVPMVVTDDDPTPSTRFMGVRLENEGSITPVSDHTLQQGDRF